MEYQEKALDLSIKSQGTKGNFVCELCDLSLENLEELRNHNQWIHQVNHNHQ